jgi:integrase
MPFGSRGNLNAVTRHPSLFFAKIKERSGGPSEACPFANGPPDVLKQERLITRHSLRHTFASRVVQASLSLVEIQNLLGHASPIFRLLPVYC